MALIFLIFIFLNYIERDQNANTEIILTPEVSLTAVMC